VKGTVVQNRVLPGNDFYGTLVDLTPMIIFENTPPMAQILALAFTAALPTAILTNLIDLSYRE
jgi:hypothetical protein